MEVEEYTSRISPTQKLMYNDARLSPQKEDEHPVHPHIADDSEAVRTASRAAELEKHREPQENPKNQKTLRNVKKRHSSQRITEMT